MESSLSQSKIFLPSKDISEIYDLINLLRTNPKEYLTTYIIPNASSYKTPMLSYLISSLKKRLSIPPLHHNCPLQSLASEYLKYLVLTDQTEQSNPRYSYQKRLHTLGLQPCQYKELIIIPYESPIASINEMILNQTFKEHLFNPYMEHIGLAIDTLPNDDYCLMVNLAGAGCSTLIKSSSLVSCIPVDRGFMGEDDKSITASLIPGGDNQHILTTNNNNNNRISTQGGEQGKLENIIANTEPSKLEQDEVMYDFDDKTKHVENNPFNQKSYIDLNRTFPMKPGVDPNKMVQEDFVNGYNVYVVTKHYKKPFNSDRKWLKDFNRGMLGYCGGNVSLANRESYSQYYQ